MPEWFRLPGRDDIELFFSFLVVLFTGIMARTSVLALRGGIDAEAIVESVTDNRALIRITLRNKTATTIDPDTLTVRGPILGIDRAPGSTHRTGQPARSLSRWRAIEPGKSGDLQFEVYLDPSRRAPWLSRLLSSGSAGTSSTSTTISTAARLRATISIDRRSFSARPIRITQSIIIPDEINRHSD